MTTMDMVIEPLLPAIGRFAGRFLEVIGALSIWHWMWENPLITLGALGACVWLGITASKGK
jgi:hypothetical protein